MSAAAHVHFVCTGNICRSPFAAALFEETACERLGVAAPLIVSSSGIHGLGGRPATVQMRREAARHGADLDDHRARVTRADTIEDADLVLTMTERHRRHVRRLAPNARQRVFTLKEFVRLLEHDDGVPGVEPADDLGTHIRRVADLANRARVRVPGADAPENVRDPYGAGHDVYAACAGEIADLVEVLVAWLLPVETAVSHDRSTVPGR